MVNVGGPSKGCVTCIKRKIRCDRQQPRCSQCLKSKRECGGYRDAIDVMFRDQSKAVITKVLTGPRGRAGVAMSESKSPDRTVNTAAARSEAEVAAVPYSPKLDEDNGLITFLLNNFTTNNSVEMRSNLFWVPWNCDDLLKNDGAKLSVQCAGAMALARLRRSPAYLRKAQKDYSLAVLSLVRSWQQDAQCNKEAVFIAVLFLGFFELLASYDHSSRKSWVAHLGGLGALFEQRQEQYVRTEFAQRMFRQGRSQVIVHALQTKAPILEPYARLSQRDRSTVPMQFKQTDDVDMLLMRLAELQASCRALKPAIALGPALMTLDLDLRRWCTTVPTSWSFTKQPSGHLTGMWWDTRSDIYASAIIANVWNKVRAARILVRDLLLDLNARWSSALTEDLEGAPNQFNYWNSELEVQQLVSDACATVPIYYRPWSATTEIGRATSPPALGTAWWSLSVLDFAGSMKGAPVLLTQWAVQCAEQIYEKTGFVQAQTVSHKLKRSQRGLFSM